MSFDAVVIGASRIKHLQTGKTQSSLGISTADQSLSCLHDQSTTPGNRCIKLQNLCQLIYKYFQYEYALSQVFFHMKLLYGAGKHSTRIWAYNTYCVNEK